MVGGHRRLALCDARVTLNVSGLRFETYLSTVERFRRTLLGDATRRDRCVSLHGGRALFFGVQFYTKYAVRNGFVQLLKSN